MRIVSPINPSYVEKGLLRMEQLDLEKVVGPLRPKKSSEVNFVFIDIYFFTNSIFKTIK